jgi:acyl-CoA synthetase (AMP-forming)/AMP-acid ligase II
MLTHNNLLFAASGAAKIRSLTPDDRAYGVLPLSHIVGLSTVFLGTLLSGATLYLAPRFDPMAARVALDKDRITIMLGVPSMFSQFLHYAKMRKIESLNLPALRIISCSGAPLSPAVKSEVESLFGMPLHHAYGITECSPNVAQVRVESPPRKDTSVGPVFPGIEVKLVGHDRKPVPAGEVGELWVRGPNVMKGYYRAPKETAAVLDAEGWFNAQDLARFEGEDLFIVGREKELIIRLGFNVYPAEVEAVLNGHPAVAKSAVVGRSIDGDEEVIAFVQPFPDSTLTTSELAEYAARNLAAYKRPSHIVVLAELPVTALGKIMKAELTKAAAGLPHRNQAKNAKLTTEPRSTSDLRSQTASGSVSPQTMKERN